jgi:hypothetical protein
MQPYPYKPFKARPVDIKINKVTTNNLLLLEKSLLILIINLVKHEHLDDINQIWMDMFHHKCHTLKYLILGCKYLLECVHPTLEFFENFLEIILFLRRAKSIYSKALKSFSWAPSILFRLIVS